MYGGQGKGRGPLGPLLSLSPPGTATRGCKMRWCCRLLPGRQPGAVAGPSLQVESRGDGLDGFCLETVVVPGMTRLPKRLWYVTLSMSQFRSRAGRKGTGFLVSSLAQLWFERNQREEGGPRGRGLRLFSAPSPVAGTRSGGEHHGMASVPLPLPLLLSLPGQSRAHAPVTGTLPVVPSPALGGLVNSSLYCFLQRFPLNIYRHFKGM